MWIRYDLLRWRSKLSLCLLLPRLRLSSLVLDQHAPSACSRQCFNAPIAEVELPEQVICAARIRGLDLHKLASEVELS